MATQFFKTTRDSETGKKMQELVEKGKTISDEISAYVQELGGTERYMRQGRAAFRTGICGIEFTEEPDEEIWKKIPKFENYYKPRLSSSEGKIIEAKLDSFEVINREDIDEVIGWVDVIRNCGFALGNDMFFGFEISTEWNHHMPDDCTEITYTDYQKLFNDK